MNVLLVVNCHKPAALSLGGEIEERLKQNGASVRILRYDFAHSVLQQEEKRNLENCPPDAAITLGGDGTALFAARTLCAMDIPILPVHMGSLGFLSAVESSGWLPVFDRWLEGNARLSERMMLEARVVRKKRVIFESVYLNDAVLSSDGIAKLIRLGVKCEDGEIGSFRSDGLIVSSPTGSTAYSAAAGGPILDPSMEAIVLNPLSPSTLANRPIVLPGSRSVIIKVEEEQRSGIILTVDGQLMQKLEPLDTVTVQKSPHRTIFLGAPRGMFYRALRVKLGWSGGE